MNDELDLTKLATDDPDLTSEENIFALPDSEFNLPLRISSFNTAKDYENFVKNVERVVRYSQEYKLWVKYISDHLGHSECALSKENINECALQVHHHPITLYTVVKAVLTDLMSRGAEFSTFDVATKVIELHFQNKVGYMVLLSDLHNKYHAGFLNLPIELVHGDYRHIIQTYSIDENEYDRVCRLCNVHVDDMKQVWQKDNYPGIQEASEKARLEPAKSQERLTA